METMIGRERGCNECTLSGKETMGITRRLIIRDDTLMSDAYGRIAVYLVRRSGGGTGFMLYGTYMKRIFTMGWEI